MRKTMRLLGVLMAAALLLSPGAALAQAKPKIGVTLHPYYSFVSHVVGDRAEVVPLIKVGFNVHNYEPQPDDLKRVMDFDALVTNGVGHDAFAAKIVQAAGMDGKLPIIYANDGVALIATAGYEGERKVPNSHTFVSITASIQQLYAIAEGLGKLHPDNAAYYRQNARAFATKLRQLKARYAQRIAGGGDMRIKVATIHGGYDYLLQEFGLEVTAVIEPAHGLSPSASQLRDTINKIKSADVNVIFSEIEFPDQVIDTIRNETGIRVYSFVHISDGPYTKEKFEEAIEYNMKQLTDAVLDVRGQKP
ncbi:MAG: zinc ABC transporter substrate-binding protein [Alphaproteobacteria bacterium]|nr:zinc ABC transporter substrate-binding protein [Alphaproteobacteria bacterium]